MSLTRRGFLRNLGSLVGALSVGLTVFKPQQRKKVVFKTAPAPDGSYLVGYKGSQFLNTGMVFVAPYIPLYQTCIINGKSDAEFEQMIRKHYGKVSLTSNKNLLQLS